MRGGRLESAFLASKFLGSPFSSLIQADYAYDEHEATDLRPTDRDTIGPKFKLPVTPVFFLTGNFSPSRDITSRGELS
jgi:hypothetical protein